VAAEGYHGAYSNDFSKASSSLLILFPGGPYSNLLLLKGKATRIYSASIVDLTVPHQGPNTFVINNLSHVINSKEGASSMYSIISEVFDNENEVNFCKQFEQYSVHVAFKKEKKWRTSLLRIKTRFNFYMQECTFVFLR
jgi:hypothetical protein